MKKLASCIAASALAIGALAFAAPESAYAHGGGGPDGHHGGGHHHKEKRHHKQQKNQLHYSTNKAQKAESDRKHKEAKHQQHLDAHRQQQAKAQQAEKQRQQRAANEAALKKQKEAKALASKQQKEAEALALKKQREAEALALQEKQKQEELKRQQQEALKQEKEAALKRKQEEKLKERQEAEALRLQKLADKKHNLFPVISEPKKSEWYEEVPEDYEGFLVSKVLNPKRNYWADEKYYLYVKQDQALALAELLESSPNGTLADYLGGVFLPFGNGESLNSITVPDHSGIAPVAEKIRALATKGDVRITLFVKDQKVVIAKVSLWNGKYGFVKDSKKEAVQYSTLLDAQ